MSQNKIWLFRLISIVIGLVVALIMSELILHVYAGRGSGQEQMDPGLVQYHSKLGWKLAAGWHGNHHHLDYDVEYNTDIRGLRKSGEIKTASSALVQSKQQHDLLKSGKQQKKRVLVLGDSFTFGLGVDDDETFTARLNDSQNEFEYINGGVPGYAPDQEVLWSKTARRLTDTGDVLFVLYLGNDLIDLGLPFPVQADHGKPFAAVEVDGSGLKKLVFRNIPVPMEEKTAALKRQTLGSYLLGPGNRGTGYGLRVLDLIATSFSSVDAQTRALLQHKIDVSVELFRLVYLNFLAEQSSATLVLLPGASLVKEPGSIAGVYQSLLSASLIQLAGENDWQLIDLAPSLTVASEALYFPNDGHLTPAGHALVAKTLGERLW